MRSVLFSWSRNSKFLRIFWEEMSNVLWTKMMKCLDSVPSQAGMLPQVGVTVPSGISQVMVLGASSGRRYPVLHSIEALE